MEVYTYNTDGYYSGIHNCQKCPKTKNWLYPPRYTNTAAPEHEDNKISRYVNNKWIQEDNYIGVKIWDKLTGECETCKTQELKDGFTEIEKPDMPYYIFLKNKWIIDEKKKVEYEKEIEKELLLFELRETDVIISRALENVIDFMISDGKKFDVKITDLILEKKAIRKKYILLLGE